MYIVLINPCRYPGYSYSSLIKKHTKYKIIAVWSDNEMYENFQPSNNKSLFDEVVFAFDKPVDSLVSDLKKFNIRAIIGVDDSGFLLADRLQPIFTPEICNDPTLINIRSNKFNYLKFLKDNELLHTNQQIIDWNNFPKIDKTYILKPVNGGGNENVYRIDSNSNIDNLILKHRNEQFLLQDYLGGGEEYCVELCTYKEYHKCTTVMKYGRTFYQNDTNPWRYDNDLVQPNNDLILNLIEYTKKIISFLGIRIGVTWTQIKVIDGKFHLIEINFRSQGNAHPEAIKNSTGFLYSAEVLKLMLGKHDDFMSSPNLYNMHGHFKKLCINNKRERIINELDISEIENLPSVKSIMINKLVIPGVVPVSNSFKNVIGVIILQNNNINQFNHDFEKISKWQKTIEE